MVRIRAIALLFSALLVGQVVGVSPAGAHAVLISAEPADGSMSRSAPEQVRLRFNEPVSLLQMQLRSPEGEATQLRPVTDGATVTAPLPAGLSYGSHVVSWRVVSSDGHPVGGSMVFSVGSASNVAPTVASTGLMVQAGIWLCRLALYLALFLGIGGAFFHAFFEMRWSSGKGWTAGFLMAGLAVIPLSVGLQGLDVLALPLGALVQAQTWRAGLPTSYGVLAIVAFAALLAALISIGMKQRHAARSLAGIAVLGAGVALAASGHASAATPQWLMRPAVAVHAMGVAIWAGGLVPLLLALRSEHPVAAGLARYSRHVPLAFMTMLLAGVVLAVVQVGAPALLFATSYGQILLVKLVLVACIVAIAAWHRWRLTARVVTGDGDARRRIVRTLAVETLLVGMVFGAVALWRFTPPPRAVSVVAAQAPVNLHFHGAKAMVDMMIAPSRVGPVAISLMTMTGDFQILDAKELTVAFALPSAGIEPIERAAEKDIEGHWRLDGFAFPAAGRWTVSVDVLVSDFEILKLSDDVEIAP